MKWVKHKIHTIESKHTIKWISLVDFANGNTLSQATNFNGDELCNNAYYVYVAEIWVGTYHWRRVLRFPGVYASVLCAANPSSLSLSNTRETNQSKNETTSEKQERSTKLN